jgi:DNA-binding IclR family transcriptional regulator
MVKKYELNNWICRTIKIPKRYCFRIIKEMEDEGFLKKVNRDLYHLEDVNCSAPLDKMGRPLW